MASHARSSTARPQRKTVKLVERHYAHRWDSKGRPIILSLVEEGAYRRLLDHYALSGRLLPKDLKQLHYICRAESDDERRAVRYVRRKLFVLRSGGYQHQPGHEPCAKKLEG